jgi:hypothetical protein
VTAKSGHSPGMPFNTNVDPVPDDDAHRGQGVSQIEPDSTA